MNFSKLMNKHVSELGCSSRELSAAAGLSESVISRYKSGSREPAFDSPQLEQLIRGLVDVANAKGIEGYSYEELSELYNEVLKGDNQRFQTFSSNFRDLIERLHLNMKVLSNELSYDVSFLYRIKNGERQPNDLDEFAIGIATYLAVNYSNREAVKKLAEILSVEEGSIMDEERRKACIIEYLFKKEEVDTSKIMESFLKRMDEFDLDEYIEAIHFNDIKIPKVPFQLPTNKAYYGVHEMREAELDFFKTTVLSKSMEPIFMNNDLPMIEAAEDMEFNKKWMFAIAASLRKGLSIRIIHNIDRPFQELMLGLEAWIPIYMTGLVSPYYFQETNNKVFHHMLYTSGAAILTGECVEGHYSDGRMILSNSKEEMKYYSKRANHLLTTAKPLMKIYDETMQQEYEEFAKGLEGMEYKVPSENAFRNIEIKCFDAEEAFAVISKQTHPNIHFVIYHPTLVDAIMNFVIAVKEE